MSGFSCQGQGTVRYVSMNVLQRTQAWMKVSAFASSSHVPAPKQSSGNSGVMLQALPAASTKSLGPSVITAVRLPSMVKLCNAWPYLLCKASLVVGSPGKMSPQVAACGGASTPPGCSVLGGDVVSWTWDVSVQPHFLSNSFKIRLHSGARCGSCKYRVRISGGIASAPS